MVTECLSHPMEPVVASLRPIALRTTWDKIVGEIRSTKSPWSDMINRELFWFMFLSAVGTAEVPMFLDCVFPHSSGFFGSHGDQVVEVVIRVGK